MGEIKYVFGLLFCLLFFITGKGQSVPNEVLLNKTFCELKNMSISCESNETFAFESLNFYYHPDCGNQCCSYNSSHSSVGADGNDIQMILRECSGRRHCSLNISRMQFFEPSLKTPSYAALHYYCIPGYRTTSICANEVLESSGLPLYFTNENYPSVTTGSGICSCSIEINSCTSDVTMSILDLDLYHEQETCEQNIELRNGMGDMLEILHCGDYSNKSMDVGDLRSHYLKINFINNSTNNLEGLFLIGFTASEENVSFSLSCPSKPKTVCLQCEDTINIPNGKIVLQDVNNTREGALANITCDTGYEPDKFTIQCLQSGYWDNATCLPKECKDKINITNGDMVLHDGNNTREGALANITCDTGYEPDKLTIKCLKDGYWDNATCLPKGCEDEIKIPNGDMVLHDDNDIKKGASANITCHTGYVTDKHVIKCSEHGEWEKVTCHLIGLFSFYLNQVLSTDQKITSTFKEVLLNVYLSILQLLVKLKLSKIIDIFKIIILIPVNKSFLLER